MLCEGFCGRGAVTFVAPELAIFRVLVRRFSKAGQQRGIKRIDPSLNVSFGHEFGDRLILPARR
jgi:putative protein kinase ArgK-like GTPase of G3E family